MLLLLNQWLTDSLPEGSSSDKIGVCIFYHQQVQLWEPPGIWELCVFVFCSAFRLSIPPMSDKAAACCRNCCPTAPSTPTSRATSHAKTPTGDSFPPSLSSTCTWAQWATTRFSCRATIRPTSSESSTVASKSQPLLLEDRQQTHRHHFCCLQKYRPFWSS